MCLKYRMSANNSGSTPPANSVNAKEPNSGGIFGAIGNAFGKAKNAVIGNSLNNASNVPKNNVPKNNVPKNNVPKNNVPKNNVPKNNVPKNNVPKNVMPASTGVPNVPVTTGGMAPVNFRYGASMQQPSEKVMEWATTAGAPMPPAAMMRNVAHGGKRRTKRRSSHKKRRTMRRKSTHRRRSCGGKRRRTMRRKSNKRRHNKRK
jgi:hypothetical protein